MFASFSRLTRENTLTLNQIPRATEIDPRFKMVIHVFDPRHAEDQLVHVTYNTVSIRHKL